PGIGMKRFGNEDFVGVRPVALGGIEEIGAQLEGAPQDLERVLAIGRLAPDAAVVDDAHRAEAEPADGEVGDFYRLALHARASLSSARRSSIASMPTDRRTRPSSMPSLARFSAGI